MTDGVYDPSPDAIEATERAWRDAGIFIESSFEWSWHPELGAISRRRVYDPEGNPLPWEYDDDPRIPR